MKSLSIEQINPFVRNATFFSLLGGNLGRKAGYDYRLIYISKGSLRVVVDGIAFDASPGSILLWRPGLEYELFFDLQSPPTVIVINFDYTQVRTELTDSLPIPHPDFFERDKITEIIHFNNCAAMNRVVFLRNMQSEEKRLMAIVSENNFKNHNYVLVMRGILLYLLALIARLASSPNSTNEDNTIVENICDYIDDNLHKPINNSKISEAFNYHPVYANRMMVKFTGLSLHKYLVECRFRKALDLMHTTNMTITEIAHATGFKTVNYFSSSFRRFFGMSPEKYLQSNAKGF